MKKIVALALAMMLVLAMGSVAMAATTPLESGTIQIPMEKIYKTTAGATPAAVPSENLTFEIQSVTHPNGTDSKTGFSVNGFLSTDSGTYITLTYPQLSVAGQYKVVIKETDSGTQGVTYNTNAEIAVNFLVEYEGNKLKLGGTSTGVKTASGKESQLTNKFDTGNLTITKSVAGNLADKSQKWPITVTLTATKTVNSTITVTLPDNTTATIAPADWSGKTWTSTGYTIGDGETYSFANIPAGVSYSVAETMVNEGNATDPDPAKGYTVKHSSASGEIVADATSSDAITNTKETTVDTGITLESVPYIMILAVAMMGVMVIISRKRREEM